MQRWIRVLLALAVICPTTSRSQDRAAEELVRQYVQARSHTMQEHATARDIDRALSLCTEDFVYEHPSAGAKIEGKSKARAGMSGYLGQTKDATYTLQVLASDPHVVVARVDQRFLVKQENRSWTAGKRANITVFEIKDGKIARILDY